MDTSLRIFSSFMTLRLEGRGGGEGLLSSVASIASCIGNIYDTLSLGGVISRLASEKKGSGS